MTKKVWTIIFALIVTQASTFAFVFDMNNRLGILEEQFKKINPEEITSNQKMLNTDIHHIVKVLKSLIQRQGGMIIQIQNLRNESEKVQKIERVSKDDIRVG